MVSSSAVHPICSKCGEPISSTHRLMFGDMSYHHHCWPVHPDIAALSARVAQLEEALGHDQWAVINRAIDRYNAGEISEHALGLIATGFMVLDKARLSALSEKEARG